MKSKSKKASEERITTPDHPLEDLVTVRIVRLSEAIARLATRTYETRLGLRNTDLRILNILDGTEGVSVNEIARRAHIDKAWISRSLRALAERDFVRRRPDNKDSRISIVDLTAKGRGLLEKIRPLAVAAEAQLLAGIDGDAFKRDLDQLMRNVDAVFEGENEAS